MAAVGGGLREAFERVAAMVPTAADTLSDDQLVEFAVRVESLVHQADSLSIAVAREFDARSDETLGDDSLSKRLGAKKPWGALETVTKTSAKDAYARVLEARRLAKFPVFVQAVDSGELGRAQAAVIIEPLIEAAKVADPRLVESACQNLIELAAVLPASALVEAARAWALMLDPDGVEPVEKLAVEQRYFRLGRAKAGLVKFSGALPVEQAAAVRAVLDAYVNPRASAVRFTPTDELGGGADDMKPMLIATEAQPPVDTRSPDQKRADVLHAVFSAQARAADAPSMGGAHPTILVTVTKEDLESGRGAAHVDGEDEPISAKAAKRIAETGGYQEAQITPAGKILNLGDTKRIATPAQRRALAVRDKGCVIPACPIPVRWTEVHHIDPARDGGPTDILNLTLLCWWHHVLIDDGPYEIRMGGEGVPEVRWVFGSHASPWVKAVHTPLRESAAA